MPQPSLQQICMKGGADPSIPPPEFGLSKYIQKTYSIYVCPLGDRQVFSRKVIHGAHYLLFYLAIVHILFSLLTSVLTNASVRQCSTCLSPAELGYIMYFVFIVAFGAVVATLADPCVVSCSLHDGAHLSAAHARSQTCGSCRKSGMDFLSHCVFLCICPCVPHVPLPCHVRCLCAQLSKARRTAKYHAPFPLRVG